MLTQEKNNQLEGLKKRMYDNIKRMLGYSNRYLKKQENTKYKTRTKSKSFTYEF